MGNLRKQSQGKILSSDQRGSKATRQGNTPMGPDQRNCRALPQPGRRSRMKPLRRWLARLNGLFQKNRQDADFAQELESHLQMHIDDNLRAGMPPDEAKRQAIIKLGGIDCTKEMYRDQRG